MNKISIFTKVNGKLARWEWYGEGYLDGIKAVRDDLTLVHKNTILALIVYEKKDAA